MLAASGTRVVGRAETAAVVVEVEKAVDWKEMELEVVEEVVVRTVGWKEEESHGRAATGWRRRPSCSAEA